MSDNARDLLVHGIAAARSNSKDEARFYLEWVLRTDADQDQQTEAWYNLSLITDDPAEKRQCLENALALTPAHPESRRDLAVLEGRLKPEDMIDTLYQQVEAVALSHDVGQDEIHRFSCPRCGAKTVFDPRKGHVACQFCGYSPSEQEAGDESNSATTSGGKAILIGNTVSEQDWIAAMFSKRGHSWQLPVERTLTCQGCGAAVAFPPSQMSMDCPFCGSPYVVGETGSRELIEPEAVLPFTLAVPAVIQKIRDWISTSRFRPGDLDELAALSLPHSVYLPVWTFDISGDIHWHGYETGGEYERQERVRTEGVTPLYYDEVYIPASSSMKSEELSALEFDMSGLVPYSPDLLADWPAEIYTIALSDASVSAHEQAVKRGEIAVRSGLGGHAFTVSNLEVDQTDISVLSFKLVLVPLWFSSYIYKEQRYKIMINGQSGEAHGSIPRNMLMQILDDVFE